MAEATLNQRPNLDRIEGYLTEMSGCEGEMCSHCINIFCEKLIPEFKLFQQAILQGMTFEPEGAHFILRGPIRFVVKNKKLTNIDPINFEPVGSLIANYPDKIGVVLKNIECDGRK